MGLTVAYQYRLFEASKQFSASKYDLCWIASYLFERLQCCKVNKRRQAVQCIDILLHPSTTSSTITFSEDIPDAWRHGDRPRCSGDQEPRYICFNLSRGEDGEDISANSLGT